MLVFVEQFFYKIDDNINKTPQKSIRIANLLSFSSLKLSQVAAMSQFSYRVMLSSFGNNFLVLGAGSVGVMSRDSLGGCEEV